MNGRFERKPGDIVEGWRLVRGLGSGGNAEVWHAESTEHQNVALKILRQRNPTTEPYRRFVVEIEVLRKLGQRQGVLPLLGYSLPDQPSRQKPAWLATPIATPIRSALSAQLNLTSVVKAVASFARTLTELAAEHGICHRDIKPENLYLLDGNWCIGDFGLVDFPNKEALTVPGRHIGPLYYLAPELLNNPESAPGPADVYSLAKTLWVLATGQHYPLPGHLSPDLEQCQIGSYFTDPRVRPIELLIGRATLLDEAQRPSMADLAAELEAWLRPDETRPVDLALDSLRARVQPIVQRQLDAKQKQQARQDHVNAVLEAIQPELKQIGAHVEKATGLVPQYGAWSRFSDWPPITELNHMPELSYGRHLTLYVEVPLATLSDSQRASFLSGIALGAMNNDQLRMIAAHIVWFSRGERIECVWTDTRTAALGSALETHCWRYLISGLRDNLSKAVSTFAKALDQ